MKQLRDESQEVLNPTPLNPTPATFRKRKRKLHCSFRNAALQKLHCNIRFSAVRKLFFFNKSCAAAGEKLQCNIEKAALQESGAFLPLSCGFQAPTFRHPRLGPREVFSNSHAGPFNEASASFPLLCRVKAMTTETSGTASQNTRCYMRSLTTKPNQKRNENRTFLLMLYWHR